MLIRWLTWAHRCMGSIYIFEEPCSRCVGRLFPVVLALVNRGVWCSKCEWKYERGRSRSTIQATAKSWRHSWASYIVDNLQGDEGFYRLLRRRASLHFFPGFNGQLRPLKFIAVASSCDGRAFEYRDDLLAFIITCFV